MSLADNADHCAHSFLCLQEPSTCHYVLNMAVPGLCQMPTFRQEAEPVTQIVCKAIASPAAAQSSVVSDTQEKQQPQLDAEQSVQDIADLVTEIIANGTEQVCFGYWVQTHV